MKVSNDMYNNIPQELKLNRRWLAVKVDGKTKTPIDYKTNYPIDVTLASNLSTFNEIVNQPYIGYSLNHAYVVIDLDAATNDKVKELHQSILEASKSTYIEKSVSGNGYHIWLKGTLNNNIKNSLNSLELYSHKRFMVCTGDAINSNDIIEDQALIDDLVERFSTKDRENSNIESSDQIDDDEVILAKMFNASNGDDIQCLYEGKATVFYPSQSEADMALMSHILFYTKNHEQAKRLFLSSELSPHKRPQGKKKPKPDYYINFTIESVIKKIPTHNVDITPFLEKSKQKSKELSTVTVKETIKEVELPSGLIGEIAQYIYSSSTRPVKEVSLAAAIALMAGISGRAYNISNTGLNHYIMLLCGTGLGKEGAEQGITRIMDAVRELIPGADAFLGAGNFASGQAMVRSLENKPCCLSVQGEFGMTLNTMCSPKAPNHLVVMKKVLLDVYNKSGHGQRLRSSVYADADKNTTEIISPALSILGESNQETFFKNMDLTSVAEGLIPRFTFIEYTGGRVARNKNAFEKPPKQLVEKIAQLMECSIRLQGANRVTCVKMNTEGETILDNYDIECDNIINNGSGIIVEAWNRAHLKAIKLAALLAIGNNIHNPTIDKACADWAIEFTKREINVILGKEAQGFLGDDEQRQLNDVARIIIEYTKTPLKKLSGITKPMLDDFVFSHSFIVNRARVLISIKKDDKLTPSACINRALAYLIEIGSIRVIPQDAKYMCSGKMYQIINLQQMIENV